MDDWTRATAVTAARQLLQRYKDTHPEWTDDKTPLDELVSWLGLQVETFHPGDYPQGTYGFLEPGEDLIWLCRTLPSSLRRFTLAHELGHVVLHGHNAHMQQWLQGSGIERVAASEVEAGRVGMDRVGTSTLMFQTVAEMSREDPCQRPDVQEEVTEQSELLQEILGIGQSYNPRSERELAANIFAAELLMPLERVRTLYLSKSIAPNRLASIFDVSNAAILNRLVGLLTDTQILTNSQTHNGHPTQGEDNPPTLVVGNPSTLVESSTNIKTIPKKQYDEFQRAAIKAPTPALIVAGPGSGKTSTLIGRTEHLIHTLNVKPAQILALTFSRKAAQEMQERLELVLYSGSEQSEKPGANGTSRDISLPTVSTFHAFCAEMLRTYGGLVGLRPDFALIDETEGYFLLRQLAREMRLYHYRNLKSPAYYFPDILKAISRAKDELVSPGQYRQLAEQMLAEAVDEELELSAKKALEVAAIYALYEEGLRCRGDTDFGGLIMLAVQLLQEYPEVCYEQQQKFSHILVDEFQDINRASGVLLRLLAGDEQRVWVVGDANQAIYGFRGASPANIANFKDDYPQATILPLSRNYRSRPDIILLAESFRWQQLELDESVSVGAGVGRMSGGTQPHSGNGEGSVSQGSGADGSRAQDKGDASVPTSLNPSPAPTDTASSQAARLTHSETYVTLAKAENSANELAGLIADIRYKHAQGYASKEIAILCRTRARARKITRALALAGLPVIENRGILGQEHIKDLLSIVLLLADASGMGILRAARQHALSQNDVECLLLAAREQKCSPALLIARNEAPMTMSSDGRRSLSRLSKILQSLFQYAPNTWSMLAQYLFMETSIIRDLMRGIENKQIDEVHPREVLLRDYAGFLEIARRYDQQQHTLRTIHEQEAEERGEKAPPEATIQDQARGFLDYLNVMSSLGQEGGSNRQQGAGAEGEENPDVIRVMTVHASKGLEFPVVYLPGLIQRNFPLQMRGNPVPAPAGMLPAASEGKVAHESGESCLFYVGVTRARDQLVLSYSERNGKQKAKPSAYLDALLAGLPAERITRLQWQGLVEAAGAIGAAGTVEGDEEDQEDIVLISSSRPNQSFIDTVKPEKLWAADIEMYQRCPRQYLYSNIYGFRGDEGAYQLFWQATQKTLEDLQKCLMSTGGTGENQAVQLPTLEEARNLYTQHWQALGGEDLPFASIYQQHGHEVTELMRDKLLDTGNTTWELRPNFTVEAAGRTIHVAVDRVEASALGDRPVKFVRTRFAKRKEKPSPGLREWLYAQAYRQHHAGQSIELHFHNLSTGETIPITLTAKKEQSLYEELEQSILGLERDEYPAKPDAFLCPTCPFFLICPA